VFPQGFYDYGITCPNDVDMSIHGETIYASPDTLDLLEGGYFYISVLPTNDVSAWTSIKNNGYDWGTSDATLIPVDEVGCSTTYLDAQFRESDDLYTSARGLTADVEEGTTVLTLIPNTHSLPNNIFSYEWEVGARMWLVCSGRSGTPHFYFESTIVDLHTAVNIGDSVVITFNDPLTFPQGYYKTEYYVYVERALYYDLRETVLISPGLLAETISAIETASGLCIGCTYAIERECIRTGVALNINALSEAVRTNPFVRRYDSLQLRSPELVACSATRMNASIEEVAGHNAYVLDSWDTYHFDEITSLDMEPVSCSPRMTVTETGLYICEHLNPGIRGKYPTEVDPFEKRKMRSLFSVINPETKKICKRRLLPVSGELEFESSDNFGIVCMFLSMNDDDNWNPEIDLIVLDKDGNIVKDFDYIIPRYDDMFGTASGYPYRGLVAVSSYGALVNTGNLHYYDHHSQIVVFTRLTYIDAAYSLFTQEEDNYSYFKRIVALGHVDIPLFVKTKVTCSPTVGREGFASFVKLKGTSVEALRSVVGIVFQDAIKSTVCVLEPGAVRTSVKIIGENCRRIRGLLHKYLWLWEQNSSIIPGEFFVKFGVPFATSQIPTNLQTTILVGGRYLYGFVDVESTGNIEQLLRCYDIQTQQYLYMQYFSTIMLGNTEAAGVPYCLNYSETTKQLYLTIIYYTYYNETCHDFMKQEILILNEQLVPLNAINKLNGVPEEDTIWEIAERRGVFYALVTRVALWDTKEVISNLCIYTAKSLYSQWELLYELPYGPAADVQKDAYTSSYRDFSIHEITNDRIWIAQNTGQYGNTEVRDIGIRLDGTGYDNLPGLLGFMKGLYQDEEKWYALAIKGIATLTQGRALTNVTGVLVFEEETLTPVLKQPELIKEAYNHSYFTGRALALDLKLYDFVKIDVPLRGTYTFSEASPAAEYTHLPDNIIRIT
jgi:hypothetical protein